MLDRKFIVENAELVERNCRHRNVAADIGRFVELEGRRRARQAEMERLNQEANRVSKSIGEAKDPAERDVRKNRGRALRDEVAQIKTELDRIEGELAVIQSGIPNMSHPDAPVGVDDKANLELARGKTPVREFHDHLELKQEVTVQVERPGTALLPQFDFRPLDHVELAEKLDLLDFEAGARVAGHGFYFLKNDAVRLELALQAYALDVLSSEGFTPMTTPDLARNEILDGTGYIPRGPETQIYSIENSDLSLIATAEIPLGGLLAGRIVDADELPVKLCGISHCFRTEAGAAGRATRGLYRVHQFTKVEMFAFTLPEASDAMLEHLRGLECRIFDGLEIPYRVVDTATGDLGGPAYRKYDLEAWMPGRGEFGEVTSTSNCTDYQARRLGARYKVKGEKGTHFVHTLNGTAIAISRALIAVLENHQQADGSVAIPAALRPWMGKDEIRPRQ
ncbi:MAG: serine--tRNA ligase [Pirellulales bacterium]|nr:serine--tRNA ligase [Pirellulales bacterium]